MAWYRIGSVSVTSGSKVVTGSGTAWAPNVQAGDAFHGPDGAVYEIDFVTSDTSVTLVDNYAGASGSGLAYKIQPTQGRVRDLAAAVAALINEYGSIESALTVLGGNVGINQGTPTNTLHVGGTLRVDLNGSTDSLAAFTGGLGRGYLGTTTATALGIITGGTERLHITTEGSVGIGTDAPTHYGSAYRSLAINGSTGGVLDLYSNGTRAATMLVTATEARLQAHDLRPWTFYTNGAEYMRINTAGDVGIGTNAPSARLDLVKNDCSVAIRDPRDGAAAPTAQQAVSFSRHFGVNEVARVAAVATAVTGNPLNEASLVFSTANGAALGERMRIDAFGNVGINGVPASNVRLHINPAGGVNNAAVHVGDVATGLTLWQSTGNDPSIIYGSSSVLRFGTQTAVGAVGYMERMRIDASGNVGLGTTAPQARLHVLGNATTGRVIQFIGGDRSFAIAQGGTEAPVGGISINDMFRNVSVLSVTSGGNVGINIPNPTATLHVNGSVRLDAALSTSATGGGASAPPSQPVGYLTINIGGTDRKVPYYG